MTEHTAASPPALTWHDYCPAVDVALAAAAWRHGFAQGEPDVPVVFLIASATRTLRRLLPCNSDGLGLRVALAVAAASKDEL